MLFKKKSEPIHMGEKKQNKEQKENEARTRSEGSSILLERYLQKSTSDRMQKIDDELLAKAIQTLLYEERNKNKHLN